MSKVEREKKLIDLRKDLMVMRSTTASGGVVENSAKIKNLRRSIARLLTIMKEEE
ncbi:MAG: 50S ribosomal protein L29 [Promethearchaeota archaeon]